MRQLDEVLADLTRAPLDRAASAGSRFDRRDHLHSASPAAGAPQPG